jgi:hypothetical protein
MAHLQRWMNFLHIKTLIETLEGQPDAFSQDYDSAEFIERMNHFKDIGTVLLPDGKPLDFQDPGLLKFFEMVGVDLSYEEDSLNDVVRYMKRMFREKMKNQGMHGYEVAHLAAFFDLQTEPAGWAEVDRLIHYVADKSMTEIVAESAGLVIVDPEDAGLGGTKCYSLSFLRDEDSVNRDVALASSPEILMKLIEPMLQRANSPSAGCEDVPNALRIQLNDKTQCYIPLAPVIQRRLEADGSATSHFDFSHMKLNWGGFTWHKQDLSLMKAVVSVAPEADVRRIKGEFLSDGLGL